MSHYDCPCMEKCPLHYAMSLIGGKWKPLSTAYAKRKAVQVARSRNIPLQMVHSCGVSSLRECLRDA